MERRAFLLLEVVVALFLLGVVLTSLFGVYQRMGMAQARIQSVARKQLPKYVLHQRLTSVFSSLADSARLCTHEGALRFAFDHGVDPQLEFRGLLQGVLARLPDRTLALTLISSKGAQRTDVLAEVVSSLSFLFYDDEAHAWRADWPAGRQRAPLVLKMVVDGEEYVYFTAVPELTHRRKQAP
jgi:hypothetical protein